MKKILFWTCLLAIWGTGCAHYRAENPLIEESVYLEGIATGRDKVGVLAATAQRRMVIFTGSRSTNGEMVDLQFCAEPSPDAVDSLSREFSASLKILLKSKDLAEAAAAGKFYREAQLMMERSQGLQLFRDGNFALCQMFINGKISENDYVTQYAATLKAAKELILHEVPGMAKVRKTYLMQKMLENEPQSLQEQIKTFNSTKAELESLWAEKDQGRVEPLEPPK